MRGKIALALMVLVLCLVSVSAVRLSFAQETPTLQINPLRSYTKIGETFNVNITLTDLTADQQLVGLELRISYNDTLLEAVDVKEGDFLKFFAPYGTWFQYYIEKGVTYGNTTIPPHILIGILILPNSTGSWPGPFPEGNGTIATITFRALPHQSRTALNGTFELFNVTLINAEGQHLTVESKSGFYEIAPLTFKYTPLRPSAGQEVIFDVREGTEPAWITSCYWDFGDGSTVISTADPVKHAFNVSGQYNVTLTVLYPNNATVSVSEVIEVGSYSPFKAKIEVVPLFFRGETCEFNILLTYLGVSVNASEISAILYFNGDIYENLTNSIEWVATGYYRIRYVIPSDAENGTYTLIVNAKYNGMYSTDIKSFLISGSFSEIYNEIDEIKDYLMHNVTSKLDNLDDILNDLNNKLNDIINKLDNATNTVNEGLEDVKGSQSSILTTFYLTSAIELALLVIITATSIYLIKKK